MQCTNAHPPKDGCGRGRVFSKSTKNDDNIVRMVKGFVSVKINVFLNDTNSSFLWIYTSDRYVRAVKFDIFVHRFFSLANRRLLRAADQLQKTACHRRSLTEVHFSQKASCRSSLVTDQLCMNRSKLILQCPRNYGPGDHHMRQCLMFREKLKFIHDDPQFTDIFNVYRFNKNWSSSPFP